MSDARALLRAQRAARRIEHPHAQYTDSGKLTCSVCREAIKSEGLWENHTRSASHRQRLLSQQKAKANSNNSSRLQQQPAPLTNGAAQKPKSSTDTLSDEALLAQIIGGSGAGHKRKHREDSDVEMADAAAAGEGERGAQQEDEDGGDAVRKKRSKQDIGSPTAITKDAAAAAAASTDSAGMFSPLTHQHAARNGSPMKTDSPAGASTPPPGLVRRSSGTPSHGVELQIPSRPATPSVSATSSTSTPKATPFGRSPLIPQEAQMGAPHSKQGPRANFATSVTSSAAEIPHSINSTMAAITAEAKATAAAAAAAGAADGTEDDDWAAFEAEVVNAAPLPPPPTNNNATTTDSDAVISAAPLTAEQIAAKSEEEERAKRRAAAEVELEDEQEEAKRALEAEFEEMEELEARVRKLKEKREAIRRGSIPTTTTTTTTATTALPTSTVNGTTIAAENNKELKEEEDEEESDDDGEEDDDWAGFRFRG